MFNSLLFFFLNKLFKTQFFLFSCTPKNLSEFLNYCSVFSFKTDNSPIIKVIASKITMLMQFLFCCHLFIGFQNAILWPQSDQDSFLQFSISSNSVFVSFFYIWEELPSISLLYCKFFKCFLKTNQPIKPSKTTPQIHAAGLPVELPLPVSLLLLFQINTERRYFLSYAWMAFWCGNIWGFNLPSLFLCVKGSSPCLWICYSLWWQ